MELEMKKPTRNDALKILEWCKKEYGTSKYKSKYPTLRFRSGKMPFDVSGPEREAGIYLFGLYDYDDNIIYVSKDAHDTISDLAHTIIHEYIHFTQNMRYYYKIIHKYINDISNHPYEKAANKKADTDADRCVEEIFGHIY